MRSLSASLLLLVLAGLPTPVPLVAQQSTPAPASATQADVIKLLEKSILKRHPDADSNKDGRISQDEVKTLLAELKKKGQGMNALGPLPTVANAKYGDHPRQVMDFWKADTPGPAPVLVYIHGGGFLAGNKEDISPQAILHCLASGVSFASINYRYTSQAIYPAPMEDGARAIQYLRSHAAAWGIDPDRIGAFGGSAGAGISMWVGFHDDLAKPDSSDPVQRQSSRLKCVATLGGQGTYDPLVIKEWIGMPAAQHPALPVFYGAKSFEDYSKPELRKLAADAAPMTHLTKDDPPLFMVYSEADAPLPANAPLGTGIHHPIFGHKLKEQMDKLGVECVYRHTNDRQSPAAVQAMSEWLIKRLKE